MANRLQLRRDGAQQWANVNPILAQGELGIEIDTSRIKIGDGVTSWNSLKYERPIETESNTANTLVKRDADGNVSVNTFQSRGTQPYSSPKCTRGRRQLIFFSYDKFRIRLD